MSCNILGVGRRDDVNVNRIRLNILDNDDAVDTHREGLQLGQTSNFTRYSPR